MTASFATSVLVVQRRWRRWRRRRRTGRRARESSTRRRAMRTCEPASLGATACRLFCAQRWKRGSRSRAPSAYVFRSCALSWASRLADPSRDFPFLSSFRFPCPSVLYPPPKEVLGFSGSSTRRSNRARPRRPNRPDRLCRRRRDTADDTRVASGVHPASVLLMASPAAGARLGRPTTRICHQRSGTACRCYATESRMGSRTSRTHGWRYRIGSCTGDRRRTSLG